MLIPIALVGHWLALYWPSNETMMGISSDFSHDHRSLIIHHTYATSTKAGNNDQGTSRNFHIDLETGSVKSVTSEEAEMLVRGSTLRVSRRGNAPESTDAEDGNALWRFSVTDFRKRDYQVLLPGGPSYPVIINDSHIVAANSQKLIALKFAEKNPIPIEFDVPSSDGVVFSLPNGKQFQFLDGLQPAPTVYLFELRDDGIQKKGSWPRSQYRGMYRMSDQDYVMLLRPDGNIETRSVLTDGLIPVAIDSSIDLSVMEWGLDSKTNTVWVKSGTQKMHYEFGTWRRIPNAGLDTYWLHARSHGRSIFASPDMQTMLCLDDTSGEKIWERKVLFPEFKLGLTMTTLGEDRILVYSYTEFGFLILDRETGATIAKHQPLCGIGYWLFAWVTFTSLWWIGWFARSAADGGWAWLDCSCFLVIGMAAIAGRILLSGEPTSETRIELRICQGVCASGVALTCLWIVFGKTRWTLKILPPIGWVAFICAVVMAVFGLRSWAVGASLITLSILFLWMFLAALVMRFAGVRLEGPQGGDVALQQVAAGSARFPLRDIFVLTAVVAVLFSVLRFAPIPKASAFYLGFIEGLVNCMLMATNAMVVSWCALSGRAIWVRWPIWLGSPLVCATVGVLYSAWLHQSKNYEWIAAYHGVVQMTAAVTIFFVLHAYRWRGWRFAS